MQFATVPKAPQEAEYANISFSPDALFPGALSMLQGPGYIKPLSVA